MLSKYGHFDYNATTPLHECVQRKIPEWLKIGGNPSAIYQAGRQAKDLIQSSRKHIAQLVGAPSPLNIILESSGSEANNHAIKGVYLHQLQEFKNRPSAQVAIKNHYLVSAVEHPSVWGVFELLRSLGAEVEVIPVHHEKGMDLEAYSSLLREDTALVSCMFANNETGQVFPIKKMAKMAHQVGALFHTDAVQALGKKPFQLSHLDVDLATFSGHKFYALRGCGVLYQKSGVHLAPLVHGGGQERSRRGGTENTLAIASFGEMAQQSVEEPIAHMTQLKEYLESQLLGSGLEDIVITNANQPRLSNTTHLWIEGVDAQTLLIHMDLAGFGISAGSACHSGRVQPSLPILNMGFSAQQATQMVRVSLGWFSTKKEVSQFLEKFVSSIKKIRSFSYNHQKE